MGFHFFSTRHAAATKSPDLESDFFFDFGSLGVSIVSVILGEFLFENGDSTNVKAGCFFVKKSFNLIS